MKAISPSRISSGIGAYRVYFRAHADIACKYALDYRIIATMTFVIWRLSRFRPAALAEH